MYLDHACVAFCFSSLSPIPAYDLLSNASLTLTCPNASKLAYRLRKVALEWDVLMCLRSHFLSIWLQRQAHCHSRTTSLLVAYPKEPWDPVSFATHCSWIWAECTSQQAQFLVDLGRQITYRSGDDREGSFYRAMHYMHCAVLLQQGVRPSVCPSVRPSVREVDVPYRRMCFACDVLKYQAAPSARPRPQTRCESETEHFPNSSLGLSW